MLKKELKKFIDKNKCSTLEEAKEWAKKNSDTKLKNSKKKGFQ